MPLPVVTLGVKLAAWAGSALSSYGLYAMFKDFSLDQLVGLVKAWAVEQAAFYAGLNLDPENPWSDASIAGAVGQKVGIPFRSFKDSDMIREDLDSFAVGLISAKSGYQVRSIQNVATLKEDFLQIGTAELSARLNLPAGVMPGPGAVFDPVEIRAQLLTWAKAELMAQINENVSVKVADILAAGDLEGVAAELNARLASLGSVENVTARQLAVRIANEMTTNAIVNFQKVSVIESARSRRSESLRRAQQKFRAAHGNRSMYVPLGKTVVIQGW